MRIAKYIHSCVLLEHRGEKLLFDPGKFSFVEGRVTPDTFNDVATIVITHDHPDHVDVDSLRQILATSKATVLANSAVASTLQSKQIEVTVLGSGTQQIGSFKLQAIPAQHEAILSDSLPRNTLPMDDHQEGADVVARCRAATPA